MFNRRLAPLVALIASLQGCAALAELKIPATATPKAAGAIRVPETAKAAPAADQSKVTPLTQDAAGAVTAGGAVTGKVKLRIPEDFGVAMPSSLVGEAGGAVISNDGNSVISNDGNSVISNDGNSLRAFAVLDAESASLLSAGGVVRSYAEMYEASRKGAKAMLTLAKANEDDLLAGKDVPLLGIPGLGALTMTMKAFNDHGELTFWAGNGDARHRFLWLSFTDDKHGKGIFRPLITKSPYVFASSFDLTKNQGDADAYFAKSEVFGHARLHLAVTSVPGAGADAPAFKLRVGGFVHDAVFLKDGAVVASANVLRNNTAAAVYGVRAKGQTRFTFKNGLLDDAAAGAHGLYLDSMGKPLASLAITAVQRAAVPADDDIAAPAFADPADAPPLPASSTKDPEAPLDAVFADPVFSFPPIAP
ncbi:MAG: hypothetical protein JWM80_1533 [Cyanobacteria bacterium RYN_339]|nr:hypothetical protein [Cyanobacteria bacterium RYN_339]